ncbi:MAG TPA: carbohydrate ABC transporter permease [Ruania sp.]|nr:carbohydrate ABC transporter permease [Ruania sp.]
MNANLTTQHRPEDARPSQPARRKKKQRTIAGVAPPHPVMRALKGVLLTACCLVVLLPLLSVISTSLAGQEEISEAGGYVLWPKDPTLDAYRSILSGGVVLQSVLVSILVTAVGTAIALVLTCTLAYSLSRPGSLGHKVILMTVLLTFLFTPGMIPMYLLIKELGLLDSYWSLILPTTVTAFNVVIMRAFFLELPRELLDSARIDGASEIRTLVSIVLPLSKAVIAVIGLFQAVSYWNNFFNALLYMSTPSKYPLQLVLRTYVVDNTEINPGDIDTVGTVPPQTALQMAILVISVAAIALVYPFIQRHFAKGILIGAVKG